MKKLDYNKIVRDAIDKQMIFERKPALIDEDWMEFNKVTLGVFQNLLQKYHYYSGRLLYGKFPWIKNLS